MASSSDGAASAPHVQETGADASYDRMGRVERLPSAQEQLLRAQLQQLGLEADDDAPLLNKDRNADVVPPVHPWPSSNTWGHDALDSFGAALAASARTWPSSAPSPPHPTPFSFHHRSTDLGQNLRFPSSRPNYISASEEVEQQRQVIQHQIEQLQRQHEQLQLHQQMLQPSMSLSSDSSQTRHPVRNMSMESRYHPTSISGAWAPIGNESISLRSNFTFPPRSQSESPMPPQQSHAMIPPSAYNGRTPSSLHTGYTRHASQQLTSDLSPKFLMAGGGLINLNTLDLSATWNEYDDKHPNSPPQERVAQRHTRSSSASSAALHSPAMDTLLTGLPQAQAQLAALRRSRHHIGPNIHNRSMSHGRSASIGSNASGAPRRALFGSYLPQNSLPLLLLAGKLVVGVLRINKRNRSDAWVTTEVFGHDIFISGSKDRNRALEGDIVAVELLNAKEVWQTKRDKADKKKRKEEFSQGATVSGTSTHSAGRRTDKARDDIEVEGAQLKLVEDEEESETSPPPLAGHVVAIVERMPGQIFPGTLALLRPSSAATKEKQQAERGECDSPPIGAAGLSRPKIIWFRPSDKRVPLIAIPSDQAPEDFWDEKKQESFAHCLFFACIKRWPITSLHPFGSLVDRVGPIGSLEAESRALLRSYCHDIVAPFSDMALRNVPTIDSWSIPDNEYEARRSFSAFTLNGRGPRQVAFSMDQHGSNSFTIGVHVADITYFLHPNTALDREARRRGASVHLVQESFEMLPPDLLRIAALHVNSDALAKSVVFTFQSDRVVDIWIGRSIVHVKHMTSYAELDRVLLGETTSFPVAPDTLRAVLDKAQQLRLERLARGGLSLPHTWLEFDLDDKKRPTNVHCCTDAESLSHVLVDELCVRANTAVAHRLAAALEDNALLERQDVPTERAWNSLVNGLQALGLPKESLSSMTLASALNNLPASSRPVANALTQKALSDSKLYTPALVDATKFMHYALGEPVYTQFVSPLQRYSDVCVHRQLDMVLDGTVHAERQGTDTLSKLAHQCTVKNRAVGAAEMQSAHLYLCQWLKDASELRPGELETRRALVMSVNASSMDILVPSFTLEKRVHLDCLPVENIHWDPATYSVTLTWLSGVDSMAWLGEAIDDVQCTKLSSTQKETRNMKTISPKAISSREQRITSMTELDVYVLSDMEKSPPIIKVVVVNPCA